MHRQNSVHKQSLRIGVVFYAQSYECSDCTVNALNNLIQRPKDKKITQQTMLGLRRTNRRGNQVAVAETGRQGGLFVDWPRMLEIILPECTIVAGSGVTVKDVVSNEMVYGFIANIQQDAAGHVNHAVAVIRRNGRFQLLDSLTAGPVELNEKNSKKLSVMAVVSSCVDNIKNSI